MGLTNRQKFCLKRRELWEPCISVALPYYVTLGARCHIDHYVIFADNGLGAEKFDDEWLLIPHDGGIFIGDDVTILSGAIIMRATKHHTMIGRGTIIGPRAHIGHNVEIGKGCLIGSGSLIGGLYNSRG